MVRKIRAVLKACAVNSQGSVTLEAGIVLPVLLLLLFNLVFFSMYVYHKLVLLDTAVYTATQRAETWNNAGKNMEDGYQKTIKSDGLYWRLFSDLGGLARLEGSNISAEGPKLVQTKNSTALSFLQDMLKSEVFKSNWSEIAVEYKNLLFRRTVVVSIKEQILMPVNWVSNLLSPDIAYTAAADVVEPVEFIRIIGLAEKYSPQILGSLTNIPDMFNRDKSESNQPRKLVASKGIQYGQHVRVFHYPGCRYISRIKASNLVEFDSPEQANACGYYLCKVCAKKSN